MEVIYVLIGLISGSLIVFLGMKALSSKNEKNWEMKLVEAEKNQALEIASIDKEKGILSEKASDLKAALDRSIEELSTERQKNEELNTRIARAEVEYKNLREKLDAHKQEMEELQKKFTTEFENIANKILKENTKEFSEASQKNMTDILNPLKEKISNFEKKVEDTYQKGIKDQTDLKAELKKLYDLNARISEEANNLTRALKSDNKKQGNWGEIILERVLERSGLEKGREYETQVRATGEDGKALQPDVVVNLPDNKHIIIDSKVSLVAYDNFSSEEDPERKANFLNQHIESIKTHVKLLGDKNYQAAGGFDTPDFVLLFMPIESAFSAAIQGDLGLFNFAWERKIVMVSPTTLLATLRTIASIWKHEKQTRNAIEIARQGGALYDKFVGFLKNMEDLGLQIGRAGKTFEEARNKLIDGRGNLVKQVQNLKELGAKTTKSIPGELLDNI
ncbi:MAG: DNA recombination protein RmuC [Bacteroidales bacterium]|nr:DNA recombination protein RmuC [Bacteroidales bacterium]MCF8405283.1 DNA recombination protein RmuC [Bacteroidales bacterium]